MIVFVAFFFILSPVTETFLVISPMEIQTLQATRILSFGHLPTTIVAGLVSGLVRLTGH